MLLTALQLTGKTDRAKKKKFLKIISNFSSFSHYLFFMHISKMSIPQGKWGWEGEIYYKIKPAKI